MVLFGRKKEDAKVEKAPSEAAVVAAPADRDLSRVLVKPRITEKSALLSDKCVYVFAIHPDATKYDVRDAVKELFKVTPRKIAIVNRPPRAFTSRARNRKGVHPGLKKAYVYLKEGDRIDLA